MEATSPLLTTVEPSQRPSALPLLLAGTLVLLAVAGWGGFIWWEQSQELIQIKSQLYTVQDNYQNLDLAYKKSMYDLKLAQQNKLASTSFVRRAPFDATHFSLQSEFLKPLQMLEEKSVYEGQDIHRYTVNGLVVDSFHFGAEARVYPVGAEVSAVQPTATPEKSEYPAYTSLTTVQEGLPDYSAFPSFSFSNGQQYYLTRSEFPFFDAHFIWKGQDGLMRTGAVYFSSQGTESATNSAQILAALHKAMQSITLLEPVE